MDNDNNDQVNLDTLDLSNTKTGFPLVPAGLYTLVVSEITFAENSKKTGQNMKIKLALKEPTNDLEGNLVNAGFPLFDQVSLVQTKDDAGNIKYDPRKRLAEFMEATLGHHNGNFNPTAQYIGMEVQARVKVEDDPEYGKSNRIARYIKKA